MIPFPNKARSASRGAHGYLVWITTVEALGAVIWSIAASMNAHALSLDRALSSENLTSAAVNGAPLWNFTPGRRWNVHVSWSDERS